MSLFAFLKSRFGEYLLLLVGAATFSYVSWYAFFLSSAQAPLAWCFGVNALLLALLFVVSFKRAYLLRGAIAYLVLVAVVMAGALFLSTGENIYADTEGNYLYAAVMMVFSATASFLLTRSRVGSAIWFLFVAFACSLIQGFYQNNAVVASLVAAGCALVLLVYRNFEKGLMGADVAQAGARNGKLFTSVVTVVGVGALACAIWFLVIAPLSPGVMKIALITDYKQLPIVELKGVADEQPQLNMDMTSDTTVDGFKYTTDDLLEGPSDVIIYAQELLNQLWTGGGVSDAGQGNDSGTQSGLDEDSTDQQYDAQSYTVDFPFIVAVLAGIAGVILLVLACILLRRLWRRRRLEKMLALPSKSEQVQALYTFLLTRLKKLGITVPAGATLGDFARNSTARLSVFDAQAKVPFAQLTQTFEKCAYGGAEPETEDVVPFASYYMNFWKAARSQLGAFKYFFKWFSL